MNKPDLDALEKLLVTEAADPFAFVEAAPALLAMARRTERLETELHNYETNHGARCDAEQERYATIAESACRVIAGAVDRLREMMRIDVGDDLSEAVAGLLRDLSAHASAPGHEVPGLRAKLAARDAALGACAARIAELLAQVGALTERRDALLVLVASISQSTPLASEIEGWEGQRAALVTEIGTLRARVAEAERELAEERARLADQAAAHEDEIRRQAAVAERVAANATKERARAERAERERDEAWAAPAEARASTRPPLDPVHVAVLRGMLGKLHESAIAVERGIESGRHLDALDNMREASAAIKREVAALEAALGEEARGQALSDDGTTEGA